MTLIAADHVSKVYGSGSQQVTALGNVSFQVEAGERIALVGASGSGKSTLLNLLAGLDRPSSGSLHVGTHQLSEMNEQQLAHYRATEIGVVFQSFQLLPHRTALQNVELPLMIQGILPAERIAAARTALEKVGLSHRMDHRPAALSGGEQQRVAIARAVVHQPKLLLADEPTGNLDSKNTKQILELMLDITTQNETALVLITHDTQLAQQVATRIVTMVDGQLQAEG